MEANAPFEIVTKLEAAERQLRVAIRMFFERKDLIAVHTIAAAALEILRQLGRARNFKSIFDSGAELIIPEKRKEFDEVIRRAQNFFKHAGKDPEAQLKFYRDSTKFYLFDATRLLVFLRGNVIPETGIMMGWFIGKYPTWFPENDIPMWAQAKALASSIDFDDFDVILSVLDELKASN